jgi:hypothetical protein
LFVVFRVVVWCGVVCCVVLCCVVWCGVVRVCWEAIFVSWLVDRW